MKFDRPLQAGAIGGHGLIRYTVESYTPGRLIQFRFSGPKGFIGSHRFELEEAAGGKTRLRHVIDMKLQGKAKLTWPLAIRPLHDALVEDALDCAVVFTGRQPPHRSWSWWVRFLRRVMRRGGKRKPRS